MADKNRSYHEQMNIKYDIQLRKLQEELPASCKTFFRAIEPRTQARTRIAYAQDLKNFFEFLIHSNPTLAHLGMKSIDTKILSSINSLDIEEYLEYLKVYTDSNGHLVTNNEKGIKRKLCTLRSFYSYLYKHNMVTANPASQVDVPRLHEKEIIRMEPNETAKFLDYVESGDTQSDSKRQKTFRKKHSVRNLAITTLLLGTGIRISECVGLDIDDVDFENARIRVVRKGGSESFVYFGDEVEKALKDYMEERIPAETLPGHENALFLSSRASRMTVRNIEIMVKDYAKESVNLKKITPHKLRSTYGTSLYRETGDIYLVANVLGHKDVNTTRKHYAALDDDRRRSAKDKVSLRYETESSSDDTTQSG